MNPAERLLNIHDRLITHSVDQHMIHVWAKVFNLDQNTTDVEDAVFKCVLALRQQLDVTRKLLIEQRAVPGELLSPGFDSLRSISAPTNLHNSWNGSRNMIQPPENRHAFVWSSFVLKDEVEKDISEEDKAELLNEIADFEEQLRNTEMSAVLREFLVQQVESIKDALLVSSILGSKPVQDSVEKFAGAYALNRSTLDQEVSVSSDKTKSVFTLFGKIITKTAEYADRGDKLIKLSENIKNGYNAVQPFLLEFLNK